MSIEELPIKLYKLEIAPPLPNIKFIDKHIPISLNPFFNKTNTGIGHDPSDSLQSVKQKLAGIQRRYRFRRKSESFLDDYKASGGFTFLKHINELNFSRCLPRIYRQPLKKTISNTSKRWILRDPVLRSLQNCLHIRCSNHRSFQNFLDADKLSNTSKSHGLANYQGIIDECTQFIEIAKNYRLQSIPKSVCIDSVNCRNLQKKEKRINIKSTERTSLGFKRTNESSASKICLNTTCSQQAGNNALNTPGSCDDVTINELACYFDTMVHIPKKMSSMAEMMYI